MLADERREELVRFERTFNLARLGGAGLAFALGPLFLNLGAWSLILLGVGLWSRPPRSRSRFVACG